MKKIIAISAVAAAALAAWLLARSPSSRPASFEDGGGEDESAIEEVSADGDAGTDAGADGADENGVDEDDAGAGEDGQPGDVGEEDEGETQDDVEEKLVDEFDSATDGWMEAREVSMDDVYAFAAKFAKLPASRKSECLQRALNLVPDANAMLLAGILLDKSTPPEYAEAVFNDVLNRDEDVKKPILELIYKDKTHPCWPDAAWILDITGDGGEDGRQAPAAAETAESGI